MIDLAPVGDERGPLEAISRHLAVINHELGELGKQMAATQTDVAWFKNLWWKVQVPLLLLILGGVATLIVTLLTR